MTGLRRDVVARVVASATAAALVGAVVPMGAEAVGDGASTTLISGQEQVRPSLGSGMVDTFSATTTRGYWSAVGVRGPASGDYDVSIDDDGLAPPLASSTFGDRTVDYVVVDSNFGRRPVGATYVVQASRFLGGGDYTIEYVEGGATLSDQASVDLGAADVLTTIDVLQPVGVPTYYRAEASGDLDLDMRLHRSSAHPPAQFVQSRSAAVAGSDSSGPAGAESMSYTTTEDAYMGLVLINKGGAGTVTVFRDTTAPEGSVSISGGAASTSTRSVAVGLDVVDLETGIEDVRVSVDGVMDTEEFRPVDGPVPVVLPAGNGTKTVIVEVRNNAGMSAGFVDTIELAAVPAAPRVDRLDVAGDDPFSLLVSFTPDGSGAGMPRSTAQCVSTDGGVTRSASDTATIIAVGSLTPSKTYRCRVRSTNEVGTGSYGAYSAPVTLQAPTTPVSPQVVAQTPSAGAVSVAFEPRSAPGAAPATAYTAQCVSTNGGVTGAATGGASPLVVQGLTGDRSYKCRVRTLSDAGTSPYSAYGPVVAVPTGPPGPVTVSAVAPSAATLRVAFRAGGSGGSPITGFTAQCVSTDGGLTQRVSGTASPLAVSGLSVDKTYRCRVRATNVSGTGAYGPYSAPVRVPGAVAPAAPAVTGVSPSDAPGSVAVAFVAGGDGGSPISGFTAQCVSSNGGVTRGATGPTSPITVTGLGSARDYRCRVRATNTVGTSPYSPYSGTVTTTPGPPDGPVVFDWSLVGSVPDLVLFLQPSWDGGEQVVAIEVVCDSTDGGASKSGRAGGYDGRPGPYDVEVRGLSKGHSYRCRARAANAYGFGPFGPYSDPFRMPNDGETRSGPRVAAHGRETA